MNMLRKLADNANPNSMASTLRRRRFLFFESLIKTIPRPTTILDVGGTEQFWEHMGYADAPHISITLLNIYPVPTTRPNFHSVIGDGRSMQQFARGEFDVVFSNSVIEHIVDQKGQKDFANETRRVGKRYFVQTPNRYFPIEPHFLFPGFQFLPLALRTLLIQHFDLGWYKKTPNFTEAEAAARSIRLLSERELKSLYPESNIYKEHVCGLTKSLVAYSGWKHQASSVI